MNEAQMIDFLHMQIATLMDALHRAHKPNDAPGDECPVCGPLIEDAQESATSAWNFINRERPSVPA